MFVDGEVCEAGAGRLLQAVAAASASRTPTIRAGRIKGVGLSTGGVRTIRPFAHCGLCVNSANHSGLCSASEKRQPDQLGNESCDEIDSFV